MKRNQEPAGRLSLILPMIVLAGAWAMFLIERC